jgi:hypothetical protein
MTVNVTPFVAGFESSDGRLEFERISPTEANLCLTNSDDPHYTYTYRLTGSESELDIIETFCSLLTTNDRP